MSNTGWRQEGLHATKTLHQLSLTECTFSPLLSLRRPCLRTWYDSVKEYVWRWRDRLTQVHLDGWLLNQRECVIELDFLAVQKS